MVRLTQSAEHHFAAIVLPGCIRTWEPCTAEWTAFSRRNPDKTQLVRSARFLCPATVEKLRARTGVRLAQSTVLSCLPDWLSALQEIRLLCGHTQPAGPVLRQTLLHGRSSVRVVG